MKKLFILCVILTNSALPQTEEKKQQYAADESSQYYRQPGFDPNYQYRYPAYYSAPFVSFANNTMTNMQKTHDLRIREDRNFFMSFFNNYNRAIQGILALNAGIPAAGPSKENSPRRGDGDNKEPPRGYSYVILPGNFDEKELFKENNIYEEDEDEKKESSTDAATFI